eukprot:TRINITY_DN10417_c0_g1_i1.p1 TRINITY_DN10417_c0_g1~~TRINITY_DN10417_c0_g1_i1.p1  ORF type:complete len:126 (-),score=12.08 TRINITY_DN10417_c0_g1_i1:142-519(-)
MSVFFTWRQKNFSEKKIQKKIAKNRKKMLTFTSIVLVPLYVVVIYAWCHWAAGFNEDKTRGSGTHSWALMGTPFNMIVTLAVYYYEGPWFILIAFSTIAAWYGAREGTKRYVQFVEGQKSNGKME